MIRTVKGKRSARQLRSSGRIDFSARQIAQLGTNKKFLEKITGVKIKVEPGQLVEPSPAPDQPKRKQKVTIAKAKQPKKRVREMQAKTDYEIPAVFRRLLQKRQESNCEMQQLIFKFEMLQFELIGRCMCCLGLSRRPLLCLWSLFQEIRCFGFTAGRHLAKCCDSLSHGLCRRPLQPRLIVSHQKLFQTKTGTSGTAIFPCWIHRITAVYCFIVMIVAWSQHYVLAQKNLLKYLSQPTSTADSQVLKLDKWVIPKVPKSLLQHFKSSLIAANPGLVDYIDLRMAIYRAALRIQASKPVDLPALVSRISTFYSKINREDYAFDPFKNGIVPRATLTSFKFISYFDHSQVIC